MFRQQQRLLSLIKQRSRADGAIRRSTNNSGSSLSSAAASAANKRIFLASGTAATAASFALLMVSSWNYNDNDETTTPRRRTDAAVTLMEEQEGNNNNNNKHHHGSKFHLVSRPTKITSKPLPTRQEQLERLKSTTDEFDIVIVGGGATGAGVALDAVTRGLSTALIERGDFGTETSSRSTKLIWAGIRYIATAFSSLLQWRNAWRPVQAMHDFMSEVQMVLSAHKERRILLQNNPHLTYWVPIAIPVQQWIAYPAPFGHPLFSSAPLVFPALFKVYDSMSGFTCPPSHVMGKKRAKRKFPQLDDDVKYFQIFYEGAHNDARTNTYIALTAAQEGACVTNHVEMIGLLRGDDNDGSKKATGITCRDNLTGDEFQVRAKSIVFAGGPFTDSLRQMESPDAKPAVAAAAGTHIVLPGYYCPGGIGMLDINTSDGRFLFFLPWQGSVIVGTTDRKGPAVSTPEPPEDEIQWILSEVERYLAPDLRVRRADVLSAWQGFRPLASDPHLPPGAPVSRDHVISTNPETGVTFITGGKWTTYRHMAQDCMDRVLGRHDDLHKKAGPCVTEHLPLRGGEGYTRNVPIMLVQEFGVSEETAKHLARTYGMHAFEVCRLTEPTSKRWPRFGQLLVEGYPFLECEVEYACQHEMACTLKDMLTLRMRLAYLNKEAALQIAPRVADLMAKSLKWSRRERNRQLKEAQDLIQTFGGAYPNQNSKDRISSLVSTVSDARDLFHTMDASETGYIDLVEFKDVAKWLGLPDKEAVQTFQTIDANANGKITEEEFLRWWHDRRSQRNKFRKRLGEHFLVSRRNAGDNNKGSDTKQQR